MLLLIHATLFCLFYSYETKNLARFAQTLVVKNIKTTDYCRFCWFYPQILIIGRLANVT